MSSYSIQNPQGLGRNGGLTKVVPHRQREINKTDDREVRKKYKVPEGVKFQETTWGFAVNVGVKP